jgi:hypothetical protein
MSKNAKILFFLTLLALIVVLYFIFSTRPLTVGEVNKNVNTVKTNIQDKSNTVPTDQTAMENDYKKETKVILDEFEKTTNLAVENSSSSIRTSIASSTSDSSIADDLKNEISRLHDQLIEITVPNQFRDLHLNLVMAFDKMENYLNNRQTDEKITSLKLISQAKTDYDWLN